MRGDSVVERSLRILATSTGIGAVIFILLSVSAIEAQAAFVLPLLYIPACVLYWTLPVVLGALGLRGGVGAIRTIARVHTVVGLLFLVLWAPATLAVPLVGDRGPWLLGTLGICAATAAIGWPARVVWPYVAALSVGAGVLRYVTVGSPDLVLPLQDAVSVGSFCLFVAVLLLVTMSAARSQDAALAVALTDARNAAEVESRARQRARFGSFVHDDVITTLLAAARATTPTPAISESARRALGRLDSFVAAGSHTGFGAATLEVELRSAASEIADGLQFSGSLQEFGGVIPAPVAVALTGALGEAIRNSLRHAASGQRSVERTVRMVATPRSLTIEASDDGQGFDPRRIAPERLGIRTSIEGRMSAVAGGAAHVSSAPGYGTVVVISWTTEDAA